MNEFLTVKPKNILYGDRVKLSFSFTVNSLTDDLEGDENFPYPDEILNVNFGETEKFPSDMIYQSKFTVCKNGDKLNFYGYAPDWARKTDPIRDKYGNDLFQVGKKYSAEIVLTRNTVRISIDGVASDLYANAREGITDVAFYVRKGQDITVENCILEEHPSPEIRLDATLEKLLSAGAFAGYLNYVVSEEGVYFNRLNTIQNIKCTTCNSGARDSGVSLDIYTDSTRVEIEYFVADCGLPVYDLQFGFLVNGKKISTPVRNASKGHAYKDVFTVPENLRGENRLTLYFSTNFTLAVKKVSLDINARVAAVKKRKTAYFFGDSITEGSECIDPSSLFANRVCEAFSLKGLNQAVSGRTFNDYNVLGDYPETPDYVMIANGTNSFCMGTADKEKTFSELDGLMTGVIGNVKEKFPSAKIIALLPIWRSDEEGVNFSLKETSAKMAEVYSRYPKICVIDCYSFIPPEEKWFSNPQLALHPVSAGHEKYAENLIRSLSEIMGKPYRENHKSLAKHALNGVKPLFYEERETVLALIKRHAFKVIKPPEYKLKYPFTEPGLAYSHTLWDLDGYLTIKSLSDAAELLKEDETFDYEKHRAMINEAAKGNVLNFLDFQEEDGFVPIMIRSDVYDDDYARRPNTFNAQKGCLCKAALIACELNGDYDWIDTAKLEKYLDFMRNTQFDEKSGLYFWADDVMIGMDNNPAVFGRRPRTGADIYLNSFIADDLSALVKIKEKKGEDAALWKARRDELISAIERETWDERDGLYYSQDIDVKTNETEIFHKGLGAFWKTMPLKIETFACYMPLAFGFANDGRAKRALERLSGDGLTAPYGIRTVSKYEKMYDLTPSNNPSNWLGAVWGLSCYTAFEAYLNYGREDKAREVYEATLELYYNGIKKVGSMNESYNPETGEGIYYDMFFSYNTLIASMMREIGG